MMCQSYILKSFTAAQILHFSDATMSILLLIKFHAQAKQILKRELLKIVNYLGRAFKLSC